jgi:N-acetylneuraminate synthase
MASKGKPMILSTGMAKEKEINAAVLACSDPPALGLPTLVKCTSAYPADASNANLSTTRGWSWDWGLSDHSLGIGVAVAAAALGATYIEKHLTLARSDGGPDSVFSMEPDEFKAMVEACRQAAAAVGTPTYGPAKGENTALRRSLWTTRPINAGEELVLGVNVATARPALGLPCDTKLTRASRDLPSFLPLRQEYME